MSVSRLNDLVYVNYNMKLAERFATNKLLVESGSQKYDTIHVDEFNLSSEWVTGEDGPCNEFVYGEEGLTWANVKEAARAAEHPGPSTRSRQARPFTTQVEPQAQALVETQVQDQPQEEEEAQAQDEHQAHATKAIDRIYTRQKRKRKE